MAGLIRACISSNGPFEDRHLRDRDDGWRACSGPANRPITRGCGFWLGSSVQFAIVDTTGRIRTFVASVTDLEANREGHRPYSLIRCYISSSGAAALIRCGPLVHRSHFGLDIARYSGTGHHLALYYLGIRPVQCAGPPRRSGQSGTPADRGAVIDANGSPLVTAAGDSPAVASWTALGSLDDLELYMVLQRTDARFPALRL